MSSIVKLYWYENLYDIFMELIVWDRICDIYIIMVPLLCYIVEDNYTKGFWECLDRSMKKCIGDNYIEGHWECVNSKTKN